MASNVLHSSAEIASQALNVRAELKTWEKAFAADNGGRKAGRDDIKQNAEIGMLIHYPGGTITTQSTDSINS